MDWSSIYGEVCQFWLKQRSKVLGGIGVVVEIDEPKLLLSRRIYYRRLWVDGLGCLTISNDFSRACAV